LHDVQEQGRKMMEALRKELADVRDSGPSTEIAPVLEHIERRISTIAAAPAGEEDRHELMHYESALPMLEIFHARRFGPQLAAIYRAASRYYAATDAARARFYLSRAVALSPDDFKTANELGALVMNGVMDGVQPSDYWQAKKYFESSLEKSPNQQRASYGLALLAKADGDLETAQRLLERALKSDVWESGPDAQGTSQVHYALACVLARRGQCQPAGRRASWFLQAMEELDAAFRHPSNQLEQMLSRDTEEGGDLYVLANTSPYGKAVDELLLNVKVGAT
jgi:tetratricopeptide (TPR) repeat protein